VLATRHGLNTTRAQEYFKKILSVDRRKSVTTIYCGLNKKRLAQYFLLAKRGVILSRNGQAELPPEPALGNDTQP
jgi:hypothetical protein